MSALAAALDAVRDRLLTARNALERGDEASAEREIRAAAERLQEALAALEREHEDKS